MGIQANDSMNIEPLYREFQQSAGICTDTRKLVKDAVFVALKGENFDGSRFVETALREGCRLAVTENRALSGDPRVRVVPSALDALQQLAHHHRMQLAPRVLAITGSNGKTTTKELIRAVLSSTFTVLSTRGNLNNHIGVPLTLLSLKEEEVAVVEMGANHAGEIASLCEIAAPDVGLITNVGKAHLEGFGSMEGVLNAKGELYEYLAVHGGSAIVDGSDSLLMEKARQTGVTSLAVRSGGDIPLTCRMISQSPYLEVEIQTAGETQSVRTGLVGAYNLQNIMLAAATGLHFGVPLKHIAAAIGTYAPTNSRSQFMEGERNRLVLDSYNANPTSMREAAGGMLDYAKPPIMLILGEMAELGTTSEEEHRELMSWISSLMGSQQVQGSQHSQADQQIQGGQDFQADRQARGVQRPKVEKVLLVGGMFFELFERGLEGRSWPGGMVAFRERGELEAHLRSERPGGYHILVKGSRVNELEKIIPLL